MAAELGGQSLGPLLGWVTSQGQGINPPGNPTFGGAGSASGLADMSIRYFGTGDFRVL